MSCAIVTVIYGVPKTEAAAQKIDEWERNNDEKWFDDREGVCGFIELYSASDYPPPGFCGVELDQLKSYEPQMLSEVRMVPTAEEKHQAELMVKSLEPELQELCGPIGVYFIWSDS